MKYFIIFVLFILNLVFVKNAKTSEPSEKENEAGTNDNQISVEQKLKTTTESSLNGQSKSDESPLSTNILNLPKILPKKSLLNSFASGLTQGARGLTQSAKALIGKRGEEEQQGDVILKAFKGAKEDQSEEEQKETDGFFSQFKNSNGKVCFKHVGCFSAAEYNDFTGRPTPVLPMSPEMIKPIFHMYTLEARSIPRNYTYNASQSQLKYSTFNPKLKTAFIIHDFQSGLSLWMEYLKDFIQYQSSDGFNVILVVWENGARLSTYNIAAANTRVVGACIGFFIETLCKTFNISNDMFYLIGHGLGGHAAGYAGKRLYDPKISRITALDPAGIGFHFSNSAMRLDSSDASIVDVIHTDSVAHYTDGFGTKDIIGHYDFFPNGGAWQPGCPEASGVVQKLPSITNGEEITCSHTRAFNLQYNLNKPGDDCIAVAYQCPDYEMFLEGRCSDCRDDKCQLMGISPLYSLKQKSNPVNKTTKRMYFIQTSNRDEFCLYHYQFGVHTTNDSDSTTGILEFNLRLKLPDNETKEIEIQRIMTKTYQRKIHTFLMTFNFKIEKFIGLSLQWKRYNASERYRVNRGYKLIIPYIEINFMSHLDESIRKKHSTIFCSDNVKIIVNKDTREFKECEPSLEQKASETPPDQMIALEWKEDIYSVDYMKFHRVFHKIAKTRIRDKLKKFETVD